MITLKRSIALAAAATAVLCATAQTDDTFDLNTQRSEIQVTNPVPGVKITGRQFIINPTPQNVEINADGKLLNISAGFNIKDVDHALVDKTGFLSVNPKGVKLKVNYGKKATKSGVAERRGAYILDITPKGVTINGYDEAGAFYGLQSLRDIIESTKGNEIPCVKINDYPSLLHRGVVEGFYGEPWSHDVRLSLIDFYGRNKMNTYLYGPKDDPYHSSPNWRLPYPDDQAAKIKELVEACNRNYVDFVWAIHPGKDIQWNEEDYQNLLRKFNAMYDLGVRAFSIFFDDIEGEGTRPSKQVDLLNRLNKDFVQAKGDVANLSVCPTDYSRLWANPTPQGSLAIYGRTLDPGIDVMYTGDVVCSDLTKETMEFLNTRIQRPGFYWWNFPVSDYCRNFILQGPAYGLDTTLTEKDVVAFVSNPMEHGEASKLALYGVADYGWNIPAYNPMDNWERGLELLMPNAADAYRTFAIHSADTETGYRRDESWETTIFPYNNYTPEQFEALKKEFTAITQAPGKIETNCDNQLLLKELKPWLDEFGKLGKRGLRTLDLIKMYPTAPNEEIWAAYVANMMTPEEEAAYNAHKSGTLKLQPFYTNAMTDIIADFYNRISGQIPAMYRGIGSYRNLGTKDDLLMLDDNLETYYNSGNAQRPGHWLGLDLRTIRPVHEIRIRQGRNDTNDSDFFDNAILEASADGKNWKQLTDTLKSQYVINWTGEPVDARYIRLRRLDSERRNWMTVRSFDVNPANAASLSIKVEAADPDRFARAFDGNPLTTFALDNETVSFETPQGAETITMLTGRNTNIEIVQTDANGNVIDTTTFNTPFVKISVKPETSRISISGSATIHEII